MTVESLLSQVAGLGVELWFEGDRLRFRAAKGALSAALRSELSTRKAEITARLRAEAATRRAIHPLSYSQRSLWFVHQESPDSAAYNVSFSVRVLSTLNLGALGQALQALIDRHATLRTTYPLDGAGMPVQSVAGAATLQFRVVDIATLDEVDLRRHVDADYRRPFDLERGPVFRAAVYTRSATEHVLLLVVHHIAADGWSLLRLIEELRALYQEANRNLPVNLPRPEVEYSDFAESQAVMLGGAEGERLAQYWTHQLAAPRAELQLPTDRPRPLRRSGVGATFGFSLSTDLSARLRRFARDESSTLFVVLLAAFKVLLMRYSGTHDLVVGTPSFGRNRPEFARVIGDFVNTLPLRTRLTPELSFRGALALVRQTVFDALDMQEYPFPLMVERLQSTRDASRSPLFETFFVLQRFEQLEELAPVLAPDSSATSIDFGGLRLQGYPLDQQEGQFDLTLQVVDQAGALQCQFKYSTELFDAASTARLAAHFVRLVESIVADPEQRIDRLPMLTPGEQRLLTVERNATAVAPIGKVYSRLFEAQVRQRAEARAVRYQGEDWSYATLNRNANRIAHRLQSMGVRSGDLVGVCLHRSLELMAALLGVQKSGGAYVPLDPGFPSERLAFMLADSQARVLLTAGDAAERIELPEGVRVLNVRPVRGRDESDNSPTPGEIGGGDPGDDTDLATGADPGDPAYVIYTSGSTGRPKGVVVSHGALVNFLQSMRREPGLREEDVLAAVTTVSFDIAGLELYLPWLVGASVELVAQETTADGAALAAQLEASGATVLQATPATWRLLLEAGWRGSPGLRALCGGEALPRDLADALLERTGELWNLYGPTETTIWSTAERVTAGEGPVTIGRPIDNTQVYVLGSGGELVPQGVAGELWIGGAGVAIGYHRRPELTAERFIVDRFSEDPRARLYRTGDLARWTAGGRLEHLGRIDQQVKIRGFRIELGEIESVLAAHEAVRQALVVAREAAPGDLRLVAYVVWQPGEELSPNDVRQFLKRSLPDYMVPSVVMTLERIPSTPNGKIDRQALPDPFRGGTTVNQEPPRGATEETLGRIWCAVLGLETVGRSDDFFELGGHSLLATQVVARMRGAFGCPFALRVLFEQPKLQALAETVDAMGGKPGNQAVAVASIVEPVADGPSALSFAQERMWLLHELDPGSAAYNIPSALQLSGELDRNALERALDLLITRHEALRTTFEVKEDRLLQSIQPVRSPSLEVHDLRPRPDAGMRALRMAQEAATASFDLRAGPVFRALLLQTGAAEHLLIFVVHHIAADQWSLGLFGRELAGSYAAFASGGVPALPHLPIRYRDFAAWQRRRFSGEVLAEQLGYWRGKLAGVTPLQLPSDRPRALILGSPAAWHAEPLSAELLGQVEALSRKQGATLFMTLFAAYVVLLHRHSGQSDITVAVPIANREQRETEGLVGSFVNTLVMRAACAGELPFARLLEQVRTTALEAYAHQELPFAKLVEELNPVRGPALPPLAQVLFTLQNAPMGGIEFPGLTWEPVVVDRGAAPFEFGLYVDAAISRTALFEYSTELFDAATVARMAAHYVRLLESVVADAGQRVDRLPMLDEQEQRLLTVERNATAVAPIGKVYSRLFEAQVRQRAEARAVRYQGEDWSYATLNRNANRIAHRLQSMGVRSGDLVGVCLHRSLELMAALLGVQKSGGAYVPLDPGFPSERLAFMLADSQARVLLTAGDAAERIELPEGVRVLNVRPVRGRDESDNSPTPGEIGGGDPGDDTDLATGADPGDPAYVIYTSGSTGRPKGVVVSHGALVNFLQSMRREPGLREEDVLAAVTTVSFDIAGLELYLPWLVGASVELVAQETTADGAALAAQLEASGATVLQATPATWRLLLEAGWRGSPGLRALCGGEALPRDLADALLERTGELWNLYGPTETTIWSTAERVTAGEGPVTIGRPIDNTQVYVLGSGGELVPQGVAGELWIGGAGVAIGYHRRPELTAERFIVDRFSEDPRARLYRTGDLACWTAGGRLEHLGRIDQQVKIRGFRIELGEIESVLAAHEAVRQALVVAREAAPGDLRLVAYVVWQPGEELSPNDVRQFLKRSLPDYMVPSSLVTLESVPLTPNGKIDRQALPDPFEGAASTAAHDPPHGRTEETLSRIWSEVLGVQAAGRDDDFFELGGHSLLATQVIARVREAFGSAIALRALFEHPKLQAFAAAVDAACARPATRPLLIEPVAEGPAELSFGQERMWLLHALDSQSAAYNIPAAVRLQGQLNRGAFEDALDWLVVRHEALRTSFLVQDGRPMQLVQPASPKILQSRDLRSLGTDAARSAALDLARAAVRGCFDLAEGPVFRALLLRIADAEHLLLLVVHHIAADQWSLGLLGRELAESYAAFIRGDAPRLPAPAVRYRDFAAWQRRRFSGEVLAEQLGYWRGKLAGVTPLQLPSDRPRALILGSPAAWHAEPLSAELLGQVEALSRKQGATLFMTLFAAYVVLLHRHSGQSDITVAVPIANREQRETEGLVGSFVNTLVMRAACAGELPFARLLEQVRTTALEAYAHQELPFAKLVEELNPVRGPALPPLAQVLFTLQNAPMGGIEFPGLTWEPVVVDRGAAPFEFGLYVDAAISRTALFEYSTELFDAATVARMAAHYVRLLESVVADAGQRVDRLPMLDEQEQRLLTVERNATAVAPIGKVYSRLFEAQVRQRAEARAVRYQGEDWSYATLNRNANRIAHRLQSMGVRSGDLVGVCLHRSLELMAALLGVQKSGGAYVPLDPGFPSERLAFMLADSQARVLLTAGDAAERIELPEGVRVLNVRPVRGRDESDNSPTPGEIGGGDPGDDTDLATGADPGDPAYVIYTSGSTGRPKGVVVSHGALVNFLQSMRREPGLREEDVLAAVTTVSFDIAGLELYLPWLVGASVELVAQETTADGAALAAQLEASGATVLQATPATWRLLLEAGWRGSPGLRALCGGEALPRDLADALLERTGELWNLYGPTETTIWSTAERVTAGEGPVTIGRPIDNTQVYVLGSGGELVPQGVAGELWIGGAGVAIGYHRRPELTAERFIVDRFSEDPRARLYRTGDLARWTAGGRLEHLGRIDQQVKIRGFRIELGEIESVLAAHEAVRQALVVAREAAPGDLRLVAYVVWQPGEELTASEARRHLRITLPDYMIPAIFIPVEIMPLTPNGKVDRQALPNPFAQSLRSVDAYEAPRPGAERDMAEIWRELLNVDRVGAADNFFELGGHSLLSFRAAATMRTRHGWQMDPRLLFFQNLRQVTAAVVATHDSTRSLHPRS